MVRRVHGDKLEVVGVGTVESRGVKRGVVSNITQTIESIQEAVAKAEESCGQKIEEVLVGIAGQHIRSMQHQEYIMRDDAEAVIDDSDLELLKRQVEKINVNPGEQIIHIIPQEFRIDDESGIKEPKGMSGRRLEGNFHVVVGQSTSIKNIARCIKGAGLKLSDLTLEPLASAESVLNDEEKEAGVALVDIGGGTTDIAIFKDGLIRHTFVIPFGGNAITEDIKEGCSILGKYAEIIKVKYGSAWPGEKKDTEFVAIPAIRGGEKKQVSLKNLAKIIKARVDEIFNMVVEQLKLYGYEEHRKKLIAGIVLTGGGAEMQHIKQLMELKSGLPTRIGYPNEHLLGEFEVDVRRPLFATSVGLTIQSAAYNEQNKKDVVEVKEPPKPEPEIQPLEEANDFEEKQDDKLKDGNNEVAKVDEKSSSASFFKLPFKKYINSIKNFIESSDE